MLDVEREYFEVHHEELVRQFPGRFIIIRDQQVFGPLESLQEALSVGARQFGLTPFLVRGTDEQPSEVRIPALALGILRADHYHSDGGQAQTPDGRAIPVPPSVALLQRGPVV